MSASNYVHLDVDEVITVSDRGMLVEIGGEEVWLPLSQIADHEDYSPGDCDLTLSVTEWIARQKGLA